MFVTIFGPDLETDGVESGLYLPLKDEEGVLGVLVFESGSADFATPTQREVAAILANQTAVALRNAQLYHQVPMVDALGALAAKRQALRAIPRRRLQIYAAVAALALAALVLIRWPLRVAGRGRRVPGRWRFAPVRALVAGVVERIPVAEGSVGGAGSAGRLPPRHRAPAPTARPPPPRPPRPTGWRRWPRAGATRRRSGCTGSAATRSAARWRCSTRRSSSPTLRAPVRGMVLTPRVEERVGTLARGGRPAARRIGRTDSLELEFGVAQRDIGRVRPGQEVRLRVDALPQRTFVGRVARVAPVPADSAGEVRYPGPRRSWPTPTALLKPSMAAYVRVLTDPASAATRLVPRAGSLGAVSSGGGSGRDPPRPAARAPARRLRRGDDGGPQRAIETAAAADRRDARRRRHRDGRERPRWTARSALPSQLYVEHDAAVAGAVRRAWSRRILADIGTRGGGRPAARAAREHRPGDRARPGAEQAANAKQRVERQRALTTAGVVTRADSEQVEFEHRAAELALRKAQRDYDLTRIVAPFAGVVTARMARVQRLVNPGDSLFRVTALAPVLAAVRVPETGRAAASGSARRRGCSAAGGASAEARVVRASPVIDAASGTREVVLQLAPGLGAHARQQRDRAARRRAAAGGRHPAGGGGQGRLRARVGRQPDHAPRRHPRRATSTATGWKW